MKSDEVGVVVIGRNEGQRLILCLESILRVGVPCVYVDSQSSDGSVEEAETRGVATVVLDDSAPINASRARNTGFEKIVEAFPHIRYIHFIDADCELNANWLEEACQTLDNEKDVSIVAGRLHEKHRNQTIYMRLCDIDWYITPGYAKKCGGIFTVRRKVYAELNGFDTSLIAGADPEFCDRLNQQGGKVLILEADMGTHDSAMTRFSQWWKRCVKVGFGYVNRLGWAASQTKSIGFWGLILPLMIAASSLLFSSLFIFGVLVYLIQVLRIYMGDVDIGTDSAYDRWLYAAFCVLAKFPQALGFIRFYTNKIQGRRQKIIEYKA
jgi:glycosyltransferase involved in cell wall biosynthesis